MSNKSHVTINSEPTDNNHAVNKPYVDFSSKNLEMDVIGEYGLTIRILSWLKLSLKKLYGYSSWKKSNYK